MDGNRIQSPSRGTSISRILAEQVSIEILSGAVNLLWFQKEDILNKDNDEQHTWLTQQRAT